MITNTTTIPSHSQLMRVAVDKCPTTLRRENWKPLTEPLSATSEGELLARARRDAIRNGRDVLVRRVTEGVVELWQR